MTRIMHRAGIGVTQGAGVGITHGAGDGLSEFPSDWADAGTAGSAAAFSVQTSDASALVTLASSIPVSDAPALCMRVLVAVSVTAWAGASTAAGTARPALLACEEIGSAMGVFAFETSAWGLLFKNLFSDAGASAYNIVKYRDPPPWAAFSRGQPVRSDAVAGERQGSTELLAETPLSGSHRAAFPQWALVERQTRSRVRSLRSADLDGALT